MMIGDHGSSAYKLRLRLGSGSPLSTDHGSSAYNSLRSNRVEQYPNPNMTQQQQQQQQQITIFYNGQMCVCDVTEIQARAIICMAKREMNERSVEKSNHHQHQYHEHEHEHEKQRKQPKYSPPPTVLARQLINPEHSMKHSLQRFLQKRKTRIEASTPYSYTPETPSPSSASS